MRWALILSSLALAACAGCTSQACRPCGPGFLGNILIPQGCAGVDFRGACREHDACYSTDCPRKACDVQFRDHMLCDCECSTHPTLCRMRAWQWYWLTRLGGGPGHVQSQMERGCDCECCAGCDSVQETAAPVSDGEIPEPAIDWINRTDWCDQYDAANCLGNLRTTFAEELRTFREVAWPLRSNRDRMDFL